MKDFFNRNMPVLVIGLVTIGVFVLIIITAQKNPAPGPKLEQIKNEQYVFDYTPTKGPKDAKVVLVEFSDFECPACKAFHPTVSALTEKYKDRMLSVYKHFPLPQHTNARSAAIAAMAAGLQGKFWEFGDLLFDAQPDFSRDKYIELATKLELDLEKFKTSLDDVGVAKQVDDDVAQGRRIGISSTPSFILNGRLLTLTTFDDLEKQIVDELAKNNISVVTQVAAETTESSISTPIQPTPDQQAIDSRYGVIEISYVAGGFSPSNVKAIQGQLVRFTNTTDADMKLQQLIYLYTELNSPVTIPPGDTFELRLTKDQLWTFKEHDQRHYGSIFVVAP